MTDLDPGFRAKEGLAIGDVIYDDSGGGTAVVPKSNKKKTARQMRMCVSVSIGSTTLLLIHPVSVFVFRADIGASEW